MTDLLKTKPSYPPTKATSHGWVDAKTGELLVAIRDLDKKISKPRKKQKKELNVQE
jgi:hypothetical protein